MDGAPYRALSLPEPGLIFDAVWFFCQLMIIKLGSFIEWLFVLRHDSRTPKCGISTIELVLDIFRESV
jgi:hypothetical protein